MKDDVIIVRKLQSIEVCPANGQLTMADNRS